MNDSNTDLFQSLLKGPHPSGNLSFFLFFFLAIKKVIIFIWVEDICCFCLFCIYFLLLWISSSPLLVFMSWEELNNNLLLLQIQRWETTKSDQSAYFMPLNSVTDLGACDQSQANMTQFLDFCWNNWEREALFSLKRLVKL